MAWLNLKIPPLIVAALCAAIIWGLQLLFGVHSVGEAIRHTLALILLATAAVIDLAALVTFLRLKTTVDPMRPGKASSMVSHGIYRYSRNPMYLGLAIMLAALALWLGARFGLFVVAGFILYMNRFQIMPEEEALQQRFGDAYLNYKSSVRRWI